MNKLESAVLKGGGILTYGAWDKDSGSDCGRNIPYFSMN